MGLRGQQPLPPGHSCGNSLHHIVSSMVNINTPTPQAQYRCPSWRNAAGALVTATSECGEDGSWRPAEAAPPGPLLNPPTLPRFVLRPIKYDADADVLYPAFLVENGKTMPLTI